MEWAPAAARGRGVSTGARALLADFMSARRADKPAAWLSSESMRVAACAAACATLLLLSWLHVSSLQSRLQVRDMEMSQLQSRFDSQHSELTRLRQTLAQLRAECKANEAVQSSSSQRRRRLTVARAAHKAGVARTGFHSGYQVCGLAAQTEPTTHSGGVRLYDGGMHAFSREEGGTSQRLLPRALNGRAPRAADKIDVPRVIAQTGPPDEGTWASAFRASYGSWERLHPGWGVTFWNDSLPEAAPNPNLEPYVAAHFPWFLPTWRRLCYPIMRLDAARYMWLYVHGGVYADLDIKATRSMDSYLGGLDVILPAVSLPHSKRLGCWKRGATNAPPGKACGTHIGNWWMASKPKHPLWLDMLRCASWRAAHLRVHPNRQRRSLLDVLPWYSRSVAPRPCAETLVCC